MHYGDRVRILSVVGGVLCEDAMSRRIINIAKMLVSLGHEIHIVQYVKESTWNRLGGNSFEFGGLDHSVVFVSWACTHVRHLKELLKDDYGLVYGNTHAGAFWSVLSRLRRTPIIFDMHGDMVAELLMTNGSDLYIRAQIARNLAPIVFVDQVATRLSDRIICISRKMIEFLHARRGVPKEKMFYVTNGTDLGFFRPVNERKVMELRRQLGIENRLVFGYLGGLQKLQGITNLVEAANSIHDEQVAFLVVGGDEKRIENKDNVTFVPNVSFAQMPIYYSACDVLVLPRPWHQATEIALPTKFAEYAAMCKPVLVTNVGDVANLVVKHNCGVVVANNEKESLVEGILEFKEKSEKELREMGRNSRRMAEMEFDLNKIKYRLQEAIESI